MRKFTIVALIALCTAIQADVYAVGISPNAVTEMSYEKIDGKTLMALFEAVANETEYSYREVRLMYQKDELAISYGEDRGTYVVEFFTAEGIGTVLIIDSI